MLTLPFINFAQQFYLTNPDVTIGHKTNTSLPFDQLDDDRSIWPQTRALKDGYSPKKDWILHQSLDPTANPQGVDPAWQQEYPTPRVHHSRTIDNNWNGAGYTSVNPADPSLDVGPNHVVQMINNGSSSIVRVWNKSGSQLSSVLLSSITSVGGAGDPIVIYDQLADRWLISEFASAGNVLIVAVSTGSSPTGSYNTYQFTTPNFPDYPKYSIWPDAYYVTTNESSQAVYALERDEMIAGAGSAQSVRFTMPDFPTIGFQAATPVSLSGTSLPPSGMPQYIMRMADDAWTPADPNDDDRLEVYEFSVDWVNTVNSTLTGPTAYLTDPFDTELCGYTSFACMDQPGSGTTLDPLREVLMNRIFYRNFGSHESIVCNHVTDVNGSDRGGVRWYEMQRPSAGSWSIHQQGTYAPTTDNADRWMAGIAINGNGDIGLAYNVSGPDSIYPSIRYTGRLASDPLNMMTEPETSLIAGTAANSSNRYGDYNCLLVDPANDNSFWFTGVYNVSSNWSTRVSEFSFGPALPEIKFASSNLSVMETSDSVSGCLGFKDFTTTLAIGVAPSAPADITITSSGSATPGSSGDVTFIPSQFTLDNSNLSQTLTMRVYDDRSIESAETLILNYVLDANGGDAISGSVNQSFTLNINDNDEIPAGGMAVIYSEDFDVAPSDVTITDGGSTSDTWEFVATARSSTLDGTPLVFVDSDAAGSGATLNEVMDFPVTPLVPGLTATLELDEYYNAYSDDTELGYVDVYDGSTWQRILTHTTATGDVGDWSNPNHVNLDVTAYANANFQVRIGYEAAYDWWWAIDNVVVSQLQVAEVATAVTGVADTFYFGPDAIIVVEDENEKIVARIDNLSSHDFGCATLVIDRAGTGATPLTYEADGTKAFTDKTYVLEFLDGDQPGNSYKLTLYYTDTEKNGWESATGKTWTDTSTLINRFDQSVSASDTSSTSEIGVTVAKATEFNSNAFSAIFSDGHGGFGVSNPDIDTASCVQYLVISGTPASGSYFAQDSIDSDALVDGNKNVLYSAGMNVELTDNFQVDLGSVFTAEIGGCGVSPYSILAGMQTLPLLPSPVNLNSGHIKPAKKQNIASPEDVSTRIKGSTLWVENLSTFDHMTASARLIFSRDGKTIYQTSAKMKPMINGTYTLTTTIPQDLDLSDASLTISTSGYQFLVKY